MYSFLMAKIEVVLFPGPAVVESDSIVSLVEIGSLRRRLGQIQGDMFDGCRDSKESFDRLPSLARAKSHSSPTDRSFHEHLQQKLTIIHICMLQ